MEPSDALLVVLRRVKTLRFLARSESATGWSGEGTGIVVVETTSPEVMTFTELGTWSPREGRPMRFSNVYRWSRLDSNEVRLEHLRFGPDRPVHLVDLRREGDAWVQSIPHL